MVKIDFLKFKNYFFKLLIIYVVSTLLIGFFTVCIIKEAKKLTTEFTIAVVDEDESILSDLCINFVSSENISDYIKSFKKIDSKDIEEDIKNGEYALIVRLPKNYVNDIRHGKKCSIDLFINDKYKIMQDVISNVVAELSKMLLAGQYGVFSGENIIYNTLYGSFDNLYNEYIKSSNLKLITFALNGKNEIFKEELLSYSKSNVGLIEFYIISFFVSIIVVGNLCLYDYYKSDYNEALLNRLYINGIDKKIFFLGKVLFPMIIGFMYILFLLIIFEKFLDIEFNKLVIYMILSVLLINVWTLFIGMLVDNKYNYILWMLALLMICLFFNGSIVPRSMMPINILNIMSYLPYGVIVNLMSSLYNGRISWLMIVLSILYLVLPYIILCKKKL